MLREMGLRAREAARQLASASADDKENTLNMIADRIWLERDAVLSANHVDVQAGEDGGLSAALLDRLTLTEERLDGVLSDLRNVAHLSDPIGEVFDEKVLPNGLHLYRRRVPIGVLGVIYEARPNVTVDIAGLALKTGNAAILRGGSETLKSNIALVRLIRDALANSPLPMDAIQLIEAADRALVAEMLTMNDTIDILIPRGGAGLHRFCRDNSRIPVITGGIGICHLFVDESADLDASLDVILNAKIQRPSVCNALDTTLIHRSVAAEFIPRIVAYLGKEGVTFRAHKNVLPYLGGIPSDLVRPAGPDDFDTEWLSLILGLKIVSGLAEAIEHIAVHSTGHSDGILTNDHENAKTFIDLVDSAAVYVNASTRFTDGAQFGLGAEVAVSTQRLHARGPMGLPELTSYKWVVQGNYHTRP